MSGAVVTVDGGRCTLTFHFQMEADADRVWRAIADPAELSAWWPTRVEVGSPLAAGAPMRFVDDDGEAVTGRIIALAPGKELAFEEGDGAHQMRFEVLDAPPTSRVRFSHTFPASEPADQHAFGWNLVFSELFDHLKRA